MPEVELVAPKVFLMEANAILDSFQWQSENKDYLSGLVLTLCLLAKLCDSLSSPWLLQFIVTHVYLEHLASVVTWSLIFSLVILASSIVVKVPQRESELVFIG